MQYSTNLIEAIARPVRLIGAGWGIGARDTHCDMGPTALRAGRLARSLRESGLRVDWGAIVSGDAHGPADAAAAVSGALRTAGRRGGQRDARGLPAGRSRRRPYLRHRHMGRGAPASAEQRPAGTDLDRCASRQPSAAHDTQRCVARNADGLPARSWRPAPGAAVRRAAHARPGTRVPARRAQLRAGRGGLADAAGRARVRHAGAAPARARGGIRRGAEYRAVGHRGLRCIHRPRCPRPRGRSRGRHTCRAGDARAGARGCLHAVARQPAPASDGDRRAQSDPGRGWAHRRPRGEPPGCRAGTRESGAGNRNGAALRRPHLRAVAGGAHARQRRWLVGPVRSPLHRHDERLLGTELRSLPSAPGARPDRAGEHARCDLARIPQHPAAAADAAPVRAHRPVPGDPGQHRPGSGRGGAEGRAPLGLQSQRGRAPSGPRSSPAATTSMAAPSPSSACRRSPPTRKGSAHSRPASS